MTVPTRPEVVRLLKGASRGGSLICIVVGLLVLIGWAFDVPALQSLHPSLASMKPNTALCFVLTGLAVSFRHRDSARVLRWSPRLGAVVLFVGAITVLEYGSGLNLGVDELFFRDVHPHPGQPPGRMSPATAVNFTLLGIALTFFEARLRRWDHRPSEWLSLLAGLSALLSVLGYVYGVRSLYAINPYSSVALHTALAFLLICGAILFARPEAGLMRIVVSDSPAGVVARRLLPAAILVPGFIGWLRLRGELAGWYDARFGLALFASSNIVVFAVLVSWNAGALFRSDDARRNAEKEVRDREEDLRITLHSIGDAVIATDGSGHVTRMNPVAEQLTGWSHAEAKGRNLAEVFHILNEQTREPVESPVQRVLREGVIVGLANHTVLVSQDRAERAIADSGAPIRDADGNLRGVVLVFRDQTEERKAKRALERSELRFRGLTESGIIGIVLADTGGTIKEANDAFLSIVGYSREDMVAGRLSGATLNTPERDRIDAGARAELQSLGIAHAWEKELLRKDGSRIPVLTGVAMLDASVGEVVTFVLDLTERKRAEALLRESEARKAAVMEAALDAIVLMDHQGTITEFNPAAERTFDCPSAQAIGKQLVELLIPPALRNKHREGLRRYLDTGQGPILGKRIEVPALRKDGSEFPAEVAVVRIQSHGEPMFTGYIRDITERRQAAEAEVLRREKQAADEANAELEAFSYSVAHDLRAPLRAINGFSSILVTDYGDRLDVEAREYLSRITSGAERMAQLIDALLSLARLSRAEPRRESVDLTALAHKTVEQLHAHDPDRWVEVLVADGVVAPGDPHLLCAVLDNLLGNAWKFSRERNPARIEFGREEIDGATAYYVRDNGAGFDMSLLEKLFAPFRRLHSEREFEGTGIGLATVQRIVRRHGGRIWAEGVVGQGATFRFTLAPGGGGR